MYNTNNNEEVNVMESIAMQQSSVSERIKEAIIEMNIMRETKISKRTLDDFVKRLEDEKSINTF
ncbi:hypothetical protein [Clostridium cylindrosporum]|uniref:Uncharacterized protein n=1 Tax=Clostridium cylindrosporum DSM 605 TaxID=1121307 RepID=A0A0J8DBE9_CLOCY|nr:hypothetical protein [Clostridium cylindrosporum]KMT21618.1 hypothetical protein CLCY_2c03800 [Clostridium cylindrosporum DSM 605]